MTRINEAEFADTLWPLFSDRKRDDLTKLFRDCLQICESETAELFVSHSRGNNFGRTIFFRPSKFVAYICLNKDIDHVNRNLESICLNKRLSNILGNFSKIGFVRQEGSCKVCTPMIRVDFSRASLDMQIWGKLSGIVDRVDSTRESKTFIEQEMQYREDYSGYDGAPTIEYYGYYTGIHKDEENGTEVFCKKFLEISELMDRDLHAVLHSDDPLTKNFFKLTDVHKYQISYQVASFLGHLHKDGVIHGDLKVENIFIKRINSEKILAKIGDFGHMAEFHKLELSESSGTEQIWSPEYINFVYPEYVNFFYFQNHEQTDRSMIGFGGDIWAFGWIIVHLFNLGLPKWVDQQQIFLKSPTLNNYLAYQVSLREYEEIPFPKDGTYPEKLLWHCWRPNPIVRAKVNDLIESLSEMLSHTSEFGSSM